MRKRKLKISLHRIRGTKELRMVVHIMVYRKEERNFTAVHLFQWCEICLILAFVAVYPLRICVQNLAGTVSILEGDYAWVYCFMEGCFESMAFCVSHTCFISFFTSSTSALLPVAFIRLATLFRLPLIFPSVQLYSRRSEQSISQTKPYKIRRRRKVDLLFMPEIFTFCSSMYCSLSLRYIFSSFYVPCLPFFISFLRLSF